jgi:penicillin-binding protein 2
VPRRKKRIPFDPPGSKGHGKKPARTRRVDQIFLTRRIFLVKTAVVGGFAVLTARLAQMQLAHGTQYKAEAKQSYVAWKERKPTRGLIYDAAGRPLAENRRSWQVSVIPSVLRGLDDSTWQEVRSRLITALRLPDCLIIDVNAVPDNADTLNTVYTRVARLLGDETPDEISSRITYFKTLAKYNYVTLAAKELTSDQAAQFNEQLNELPGVQVVNYLDYLVLNFKYNATPISVKSNVARDVALKLEANRLYLPGVELDDSVLTRHYPGGPVMSHILGYVGQIQDADLNSDANIASVDGDQITYKTYQPDDIIGQTGIERQLEELLRGHKGGVYYERDGDGIEVRELSAGTPAVPGKNIKLTVDLELQAAISNALANGILASTSGRRKTDPKASACRGGAAVMMSPKTGEVFALVSYPTYDNQLFIDGLSALKAKEYGLGITGNGTAADANGLTSPLTDRSYAAEYAPGSTIKPFLALSALHEGTLDANTTYSCTGAIHVPYTWDESKGNYYYCWVWADGLPAHGQVTVETALMQSCDVFFYNAGTPKQKPEGATQYLHYTDVVNFNRTDFGDTHYFDGLGIDKIHKNLTTRFWFGKSLGIELPGEAEGLMPNNDWKVKNFNEGWTSGDTINASIGQGYVEASPLQLAANTAAIANGGLILKPTIIKSIVDDDGKDVQTFNPQKLRRINMKSSDLGTVHSGMRRVVSDPMGTANHNLDQSSKWLMTNPDGLEEIPIAGKTGTAETGAADESGIYSDAHAYFTCFAPFDDPEVVLTIFLELGGEGATYAVPIADKAMRAYFELTGKRPRGAMLRTDKQPISDQAPAPTGDPAASGTPTAET